MLALSYCRHVQDDAAEAAVVTSAAAVAVAAVTAEAKNYMTRKRICYAPV